MRSRAVYPIHKLPAFYGVRNFITVFIRASSCFLSHFHILIFTVHFSMITILLICFPNDNFVSCSCTYFPFPVGACNHILPLSSSMITSLQQQTLRTKQHKLCSFSLRNITYPITSSAHIQIRSLQLFPNTTIIIMVITVTPSITLHVTVVLYYPLIHISRY